MRTEKLRIQNLSVDIGNEKVIENINFAIYENEIACLYVPDAKCRSAFWEVFRSKAGKMKGNIYINGKKAENVWEEFCTVGKSSHLIPNMSVAENLFLTTNEMYSLNIAVRQAKMIQKARRILKQAHLGHINPKMPVFMLNAVEQNYIEMLKGISSRKQFLFLEDITGIYREYEIERLKGLIYFLRQNGITIIYMAEKMTDIIGIMNRLVIVINGTVISSVKCNEDNIYAQIEHVLPPIKGINQYPEQGKEEVLHIADQQENIIFSVTKQEVLGVYDGMWRVVPELIDLLKGRIQNKQSRYRLSLDGEWMRLKNYYEVLKEGIVVIDEKEQQNLVLYNMNLSDNVTIMEEDVIRKGFFYSERLKHYMAEEALDKIGFKELFTKYGKLSGLSGLSRNEEMAIAIARTLCIKPRVILLVNPQLSYTDVNLWQLQEILIRLKNNNISCIIFSRQQKQLERLCDRIVEPVERFHLENL